MALFIKSVGLLTLVVVATAQYPKFSKAPKKYQPATATATGTQQPTNLQTPYDSYAVIPTPQPALPPLSLQLPRLERPQVPFYTAQPSPVLRAPQQYSPQPTGNFHQYPVPSQELQVPSQVAWNPNNDPKFFYPVVPAALKTEQPTNLYPKKYNKELHEEAKPLAASRAKVELSSWNGQQQDRGQAKKLSKALQALAKQENQRRILAEKVQTQKKQQKHQPQQNRQTKKSAPQKRHKYEPSPAASGYALAGYDEGLTHEAAVYDDEYGGYANSEYASHDEYVHGPGEYGSSYDEYTQGLSDDLKANLGLPNTSPSERLDFHMQGHDGPESYKFGYDAGKGHDRQFRYEEKDALGFVKGHYGYYDNEGKLQMVHYDSNPYDGFHAEGNFGRY